MTNDLDRERFAGVERHYGAWFPNQRFDEFTWDLGPVGERLPGFRVRRITPSNRSEPWVYLSVGAFLATGDEADVDGSEFMILAPKESPSHVESLAMVANFHADTDHRIDVGGVVRIGRPWVGRSRADHFVASLPYPYGPEFEVCPIGDRTVRVRWLVPITEAEAAFVREHGFDAFEERLESSGADLVSTRRRSVV